MPVGPPEPFSSGPGVLLCGVDDGMADVLKGLGVHHDLDIQEEGAFRGEEATAGGCSQEGQETRTKGEEGCVAI